MKAIDALLGPQASKPPKGAKASKGGKHDNYRRAVGEFMAAVKGGDEGAAADALEACILECGMDED